MDMDSAIEIADAVRRRETRAIDVLNEIRPMVEHANDALVAFVHLDWSWQSATL